MGDLPGRTGSIWDRLRGHTFVRAGLVYGSAVFFLLQVFDVLGFPAAAIRAFAIVAVVGFLVGEAFYLWRSSRPPASMPAHERVRRWVLGGRRWVGAALLLLIAGAGAWLTGRRLIRSPVRAGTDVIAVLPFVASGADVEDLGVGIVSLLSTALDQVGGIRTIDPGTVLHGWTRSATDGTLDLDGALGVGRDVGAGAILRGSVTTVREAVEVSGEIYTVDGERVAHHQERGDIDDLQALIDRLSVQLLREIWRDNTPIPDLRIAAITTGSPAALRAFLRGENYLRSARYDSAAAAFEDAVGIDTAFALAYYRMAEAYGWSLHIGAEPSLRAAEAANRLAARLPERERSLAAITLLHEKEDFAALDSIRALTRRHPDDALAWYLLGDVLTHARPMIEPPPAEYKEPFERAVQLDPTPAGGVIHVLEEALRRGDRALFDEFLAHYEAAAGPERGARWRDLARVRWAAADSLLDVVNDVAGEFRRERVPGSYGGRLQELVTIRFATEMELDPSDLIAETELAPRLDPGSAAPALELRTYALADAGRVREASALLDTLAQRYPQVDRPPPYFTRIVWSATGLYPPDSVETQLALVEQDTAAAPYAGLIQRMLYLGRGDVGAADAISSPGLPARAGKLPAALDAWAVLLHGDTAGGLELMRQAIHEAGYSIDARRAFDSGPLFAFAVGLASREETRAEGVRRLSSYLHLGSTYTVPAWLAIAEARESEGDRAGAAQAYAHVVRLWENADPHLQPVVQRARDALARLTGEGRSG